MQNIYFKVCDMWITYYITVHTLNCGKLILLTSLAYWSSHVCTCYFSLQKLFRCSKQQPVGSVGRSYELTLRVSQSTLLFGLPTLVQTNVVKI